MKFFYEFMMVMPLLSFCRPIYLESVVKGTVSIGVVTSNCQTFTKELSSYGLASLEIPDECAITKVNASINTGAFMGQEFEHLMVTDPYDSYKVVILPSDLPSKATMNVIFQK